MDADTRHQLKQNELAEALGRLKDFSDKRTIGWAAVILVIVLAYAGFKFWRWRQHVQLDQAHRVLRSIDPTDTTSSIPLDRLRQLIAENDQPGLVAMARLQLAEGLEEHGLAPGGGSRLDEAGQQYQTVVDMAAAPISIRSAAAYRLGLLHETKRDFQAARDVYTSLKDGPHYAGSPFVTLAAMRLDELDDLAVRIEFEPGAKPLSADEPPAQLGQAPSPGATAADTLPPGPTLTSQPVAGETTPGVETPGESGEPPPP